MIHRYPRHGFPFTEWHQHGNRYFNSFSISKASTNTLPVFQYFFSNIQNAGNTIKGIIIDLRANNGGEIIDLDYLLGQMISSPLVFGFTTTKNGPNRLDYTPWAPATVKPWNGGANVTIPLVVLGDHLSASMAEIATVAIKAMPNGKFIGTKTLGATGVLASDVYYNGGQFTIGIPYWGNNGYLSTYTSSPMFKSLKGEFYEGVGVTPDIYCKETEDAFTNNHDLVIDSAIKYITAH